MLFDDAFDSQLSAFVQDTDLSCPRFPELDTANQKSGAPQAPANFEHAWHLALSATSPALAGLLSHNQDSSSEASRLLPARFMTDDDMYPQLNRDDESDAATAVKETSLYSIPGGWDEGDTTLDPTGGGFYVGDYFADSVYANWVCGTGLLWDFVNGLGWCDADDAIVVQGPSWEDVALGNDATLRFFSTGDVAFYINGVYQSDVEITSVSATNGTPSFGVNISSSGGGFTYSSNDSQTYTFVFTNRY